MWVGNGVNRKEKGKCAMIFVRLVVSSPHTDNSDSGSGRRDRNIHHHLACFHEKKGGRVWVGGWCGKWLAR